MLSRQDHLISRTNYNPSYEERGAEIDSLKALEAEITEIAGHINCATYRFLKLGAEFDMRKVWRSWKTQSCAHWLNWKCDIEMGAAKLRKIAAEMECGKVSLDRKRQF